MAIIDEITNDNMCNADDPNAELGIKNSVLYDPTNNFVFNKTHSEDVWQGQNNTWIVLGRDRPGGMDSGYGGMGHLRAGAIDIVVGRLSALDARSSPGVRGPINSNTGADAARIYISQKSDIDDNYNLCEGIDGTKSYAQSAIAIKADAVRIIARESLKLITNTDSKLSNGNESYKGFGIQLIANNDDKDMQPIPKGQNLLDSLEELADFIQELCGVVTNFYNSQARFNEAISDHTHYENYHALETSLDPNLCIEHKSVAIQLLNLTKQGLQLNTGNLEAWRSKYIRDTGSKYINSSYHHLN